MKYRNSQRNFLYSILTTFLTLFCFSVPAFSAEWSVFASMTDTDGSYICKFEVPIEMYISSKSTFSELDKECIYSVQIVGKLLPEDIKKLDSIVTFLNSNKAIRHPSAIALNSPGGSVSASLAIANEIRNPSSPLYKANGFIATSSECLSSCVLILAATFNKTVSGAIGIHRPRFLPGEYESMGYETLQSAYSELYEKLRKFFKDTNIHPSFADAMWSVPSSDIRYLTQSEIKFYRLNGEDLVQEEEQNMRLIQVCGESGPAMERDFMSKINARCKDSSGKVDSDCWSDLLNSHPYGHCLSMMYEK